VLVVDVVVVAAWAVVVVAGSWVVVGTCGVLVPPGFSAVAGGAVVVTLASLSSRGACTGSHPSAVAQMMPARRSLVAPASRIVLITL
jgi:hypothetical protein